MIYVLLFFEFFKIGLFAIGGGMVTIPFLFNLAENYPWFNSNELIDMIAVAEATPGPLGVNMATFAGFRTAGIWGSFAATIGLVMPSLVIIVILAKILSKYHTSNVFLNLMYSIRPAVIALICYAGFELAKVSLPNGRSLLICLIFWGAIRLLKLHPIAYIVAGGILGIYFNL